MRTKGWNKVFSFTFLQYVKSKSFIVSTIVVCIISAAICVLTNVLPNVMMSAAHIDYDDTSDDTTGNAFLDNGRVYLFDEAGILAEEDKQTLGEIFKGRFEEPDKSLDDVVAELKSSEDIAAALRISAQTDRDGGITGYEIRSYYTSGAKSSVDVLNENAQYLVNRRILLNAGVAPEKYGETQVSVFTSKTEAGANSLNEIQSMVNYALPLLTSIVLFLLIFTYGQLVAQSIATEKTSRVMELLLTSVRPLAVVIGKVLAMGLVSFLQFFLIIIVGWLSLTASAPFGWISKATELMQNPEIQTVLSQMGQSGASGASLAGVSTSELEMAQAMSEFSKIFTPANIIAIILIFILGFLFFSLIAALIGASVSRMEDLQAAMTPYSLIGVLGMYISYFPVIFNVDALENGDGSINPVQMFSYFFPISSPFSLPSAVLLRTLEPLSVVIAIAVLALFVVLIAVAVSKVYEAIILHNGNRIKFGDILKMAVRK